MADDFLASYKKGTEARTKELAEMEAKKARLAEIETKNKADRTEWLDTILLPACNQFIDTLREAGVVINLRAEPGIRYRTETFTVLLKVSAPEGSKSITPALIFTINEIDLVSIRSSANINYPSKNFRSVNIEDINRILAAFAHYIGKQGR